MNIDYKQTAEQKNIERRLEKIPAGFFNVLVVAVLAS
jgi:hypothetical protein